MPIRIELLVRLLSVILFIGSQFSDKPSSLEGTNIQAIFLLWSLCVCVCVCVCMCMCVCVCVCVGTGLPTEGDPPSVLRLVFEQVLLGLRHGTGEAIVWQSGASRQPGFGIGTKSKH